MGSVETMWALSSYSREMQQQPMWALLAGAWLQIQPVKEARIGKKILQMVLFQVESNILNRGVLQSKPLLSKLFRRSVISTLGFQTPIKYLLFLHLCSLSLANGSTQARLLLQISQLHALLQLWPARLFSATPLWNSQAPKSRILCGKCPRDSQILFMWILSLSPSCSKDFPHCLATC